LVHTGQHRTEDKLKIQTLYLNKTQAKKQTTQNTAKNYPGLVAFYDTWPRYEVGLFYNAPEPTRGSRIYQDFNQGGEERMG